MNHTLRVFVALFKQQDFELKTKSTPVKIIFVNVHNYFMINVMFLRVCMSVCVK